MYIVFSLLIFLSFSPSSSSLFWVLLHATRSSIFLLLFLILKSSSKCFLVRVEASTLPLAFGLQRRRCLRKFFMCLLVPVPLHYLQAPNSLSALHQLVGCSCCHPRVHCHVAHHCHHHDDAVRRRHHHRHPHACRCHRRLRSCIYVSLYLLQLEVNLLCKSMCLCLVLTAAKFNLKSIRLD